MNLIIKDAVRQILWRLASAIWWFLVIKIITPYLGPLRFGDYSTILKYFAIRSAFADFGLYVIAMKQLWEIKKKIFKWKQTVQDLTKLDTSLLSEYYNKFVSSRLFMICVVYVTALLIAYLIPSYTSNPYLVRGLPLWMIFSASFMTAGILQIPLQLFWKMKHLSIALILARIVQLIILVLGVYVLYAWVDFNTTSPHIFAFNCILVSVIASWITQWLYVFLIGRKYLPLNFNRDWSFTKNIITENRKYGLAYYLSSFHTLIVLILISVFFPTSEGFIFAGIYWLALSLIEILLVIPSALWNSMLHDIWEIDLEKKKNRFWALLFLVILIWWFVIANFILYWPHVIHFLWWPEYLTTSEKIWSDYILPFLWWVITLSFIKQVYNYLFVSTKLHNTLLWINLFGVTIWVIIWIPLLLKFQLRWGVITQVLLELLFVLWAIYIALRNNVLLSLKDKITKKMLWKLLLCWALFGIRYYFFSISVNNFLWIAIAANVNLLCICILFEDIKQILKKL